ncbi:hypothetical protein JGS6364_26811 [[Clostridium] sordellii]|uniref:hypothetical protein n=1 Tax=Paraclostridium sordellii TaxID=1505 RepID=UPI0003133811|nr:hypothetical protein [Paeniclostridium sordellii]TAN66828.1 hypothetical protein WS9_009625 [Paeniclostridium sordellii 8483]CEK32169.1 hypothetical protein JGS6364_26811 [[Clostridium] sordellii] [Paeniclostridium sordellii]
MRWILVILILYVLPIGILFKNKESFKRASIYGSMYTVVVTVIVISNIYISTLNKMEVFLNNKYTFDEKYEAKSEESHKEEINRDKVDISVKEQKDIKENEVISIELTDKEIVKNFKEEIYDIERQALVPMRECMPDLKNLKVNLQTIKDAKKDVSYAKSMCEKVVKTYEAMDVPKLKNEENTAILNDAKKCVQKAYILRGKAMDCAQELLNSKNLKYVSEIKEYLRLSDLEIEKFLNNMKQL